MKVIDLLNKIANGEEVPKKIRIYGWCYEFEWIEYKDNYYDKSEDIDLMSALSMCSDELNRKVEIIEENDKIEKLDSWTVSVGRVDESNIEKYIHKLFRQQFETFNKLNEIINKINEMKKE